MSLEQRINHAWQQDSLWLKLMLPLSWLFSAISALRRSYLQWRYQGQRYAAPVIVVGNISVGGSGKTPLIVALVGALQQRGYKPGVVSRGYGGKAAKYPLSVNVRTAVTESGDEPKLIAQLADCPVVVDGNRRAAVAYLLSHHSCDLVLSDDGLQHYRLHRDIEIVVVDGQRGFGNRRRLPAGPLRESPRRLGEADFVIVNGDPGTVVDGGHMHRDQMAIVPRRMRRFNSPDSQPIKQWLTEYPLKRVHGVAAIGNPQRFSLTLEELGLEVQLHSHDDHQALNWGDLVFEDDLAVIITAKDAIKLVAQGVEMPVPNLWVLEIEAEIENAFIDRLVAQLNNDTNS